MMLALGICLGYLLAGLLGARNRYRLLRPLTVPANCDKGILCNYGRGPHYERPGYRPCYRSPAGQKLNIGGEAEAVTFALLMGLGWPVIFAGLGIKWIVTVGNHKQEPDELSARIAELEHELEMDR